MDKFIIAGGCAVRIRDIDIKPKSDDHPSKKPTLFLLHGYLESLEVWDEFTSILAPYFRVISMDIPGHGISEVKGDIHTMEFLADTVIGVLDALKIDNCYIAGHSMGGYVALETMRKYPDRISGLIMIHSVPYADTAEKKEHREREIAIVEAGKKDLLATSVDKSFAADNRKKFADWIADLQEQVILTDDEGILALLRGMELRPDQNDMLRASNIPQLFIFGLKDEYIPVEIAERVASEHPQARVLWLENSGHMCFIEEPQKTAEAVFDFCRIETHP